jgi:asparagine synthase (glutamine-hydrolysing)
LSAIFGLFRHDSAPVDIDHLRLMAEPVLARGPDGLGLHVEGPVGLGVTRLQTCPEREPVAVDGSGALVVVAAARLDNREDLVSALALGRQAPDTEIITHAHRKWGRDAAAHLLGAFGYAVWDRTEQALTLVRDHIGVCPFYLAQTRAFTAFANDPRSLLALPEVAKDLDDAGVFAFFFPELLFQDKQTTCFAAIKRLPPAHTLELTPDGETGRRIYWALDPERELRLAGDEEYTEAFLERFTLAVKRTLRSAGEVGSKLSGGMDSSSITGVAAKLLAAEGRPPLHTFSAVFPDSPTADESVYSQAVARHSGVIAHQIRPGEQSPLADLPLVLQAITQPVYAPNLFIASGATRAAQGKGLRIMLDGTDGDSTVGHGVDLLHECAGRHDWAHFSREAEAITTRFDSRQYATRDGIVNAHALPELQRLAHQGRWLATLRGVHVLGRTLGLSRRKLLSAALAGRRSPGPVIPDLSHLDPDFVARAQGVARLEEFARHRSRHRSGRRVIQWEDLTSGAIPVAMETFDRIGAMHGVEYRYPFCDRELMEFCLAMPCELQLRNGWSRWIMRNAMASCLPDQVRWRGGKADLTPISDRGLRVFEIERLGHLAHAAPQSVLRFIRGDALAQAHEQYIGKGSGLGRDLLWRAAVLEIWSDNLMR